MEHITGDQWWTRYQPVSYNITSRSGSREEFASMIARCKKVGVSIYADAVFNHMAADAGTGMGGSNFTSRDFPAVPYTPDDFHHNPGDTTTNCAVTDFTNQTNVQECDLVGLPDLDTNSPKVQKTIGAYLKDLRSLGVGGFRVDAAKHQEAGQLESVLRDGPGLYSFLEVIEGYGEAVQPAMYFGDGQVTEFDFSNGICPKVKGEGQMNQLTSFSASGWNLVPSDDAVVFIDNHDSQRGGAGLTYKDGALYILANVFMLGTPYGYPKVMSSYGFDDHDQGAMQRERAVGCEVQRNNPTPPHPPLHRLTMPACLDQVLPPLRSTTEVRFPIVGPTSHGSVSIDSRRSRG